MSDQQQQPKIRVVARVRPKTRRELADRIATTRLDDYTTLRVAGSADEDVQDVRQAHFRFDAVYNEDDDQVTIYEEEVAELVDAAVLQGQPGTVIAYGMSGSGKTTTILGRAGTARRTSSTSNSSSGAAGAATTATTTTIELHEESGIFLRVFCDLFRCPGIDCVTLSAVELYLDDVFDLLDGRAKKKLRDTGTEVVVQGMTEMPVSSLEQVMQVFEVANSARSVSSTQLNEQSSRSHAIFFITIPADAARGRPAPVRLLLVDLAGSERIKKSKAEGGAAVEAAAINSSLSTLGTVVHAMYVNSNHVPYRDSKLTGVLKATFANRACRVLLIGQFSPVAGNAAESISTAKFCDRVKGLAVANSAFSAGAGGAGGGLTGEASEEDKAAIAAMQQYGELSTEMRIARAVVGLHSAGGRRSFKPRAVIEQQAAERRVVRFQLPPDSGAADDADSPLKQQLRAEIQQEIEAAEQLESREAVRRCDALKQQLLQQHMARRLALKNDLMAWRGKLGGVQSSLSQTQEGLEAEINAKTTEAKRAKKKRVTLEERLAEVRARDATVTKGLLETPENYVLPPSLVDFDADDDPEAEAAEKRHEASHAIIATFYQQWRTLGRLHSDAVVAERRQLDLRHEGRDLRRTGSAASFAAWQLAADIVHFSWRRAVDVSTGAIAPNEPWAWSDVEGSSAILEDAPFWAPNPLSLVPGFPRAPVDDEARRYTKTVIPADDDDEVAVAAEQKPVAIAPQQQTVRPAAAAAAAVAATAAAAAPTARGGVTLAPLGASSSDEVDNFPEFSVLPGKKAQSTTAATGDNNKENNTGASTTASTTATASVAAAESKSAAAVASAAAASAAAAAGGDDAANAAAKRRRKKTPEELALAEKHYLMSIYDSKTLVADIAKFLQSGTKVMKHGRAGDPHQKHARIRNGVLFWFDPTAKTELEQTKTCIPLTEVGSIVLGPHSKVFKRNPITPADPSFFLSFTLHLKDGSRSLDLVAENLVDFEAWVIGAVHMCRVDAQWGKPLPCAQLEPLEYNALTPFEKALCDKENILPSVFTKVRARVIEQRNDIAMHMRAFRGNTAAAFETLGGGIHLPKMSDGGAVLMTKGELRYHCSAFHVDIFRVCKLWEYFRDASLIFDPEYTPICTFGTTTAK